VPRAGGGLKPPRSGRARIRRPRPVAQPAGSMSLKDWGSTGVRADALGNATGRPMAANDQFYWDAASPIPAETTSQPGSFVTGNRLLVWQDARYEYDAHGNLIERLQGKARKSGADAYAVYMGCCSSACARGCGAWTGCECKH